MSAANNVVEIRATKKQGHEPERADKLVPRRFSAVAKVLWPNKTAEHLAYIAKADKRTARRWLSGEYEPPLSVILAIMHEMLREQTELDLR